VKLLELILSWIQLAIGKVDNKTAGRKSFKLNQKEYDYLDYLVTTKYNQLKYFPGEIDEYTGLVGVGLAHHVKRAIQAVKDNPGLMQNKYRRNFIKMSPTKAAKSLCNTICRYIWMEMSGIDLPPFYLYYIECINAGNYMWSGNVYSYMKTSDPAHGLILPYMRNSDYKEFKYEKGFKNTSAMVAGFLGSKEKVALARKGNSKRSTHTYLVANHNGECIMFDQHHTRYTGDEITERHPRPDKLYYLYWY